MNHGDLERALNEFRMFPEALVAYSGHGMLLTDVHGRIRSGMNGYYYQQTRFLSRLLLRVDGLLPRFVSANLVDPDSLIAYYLASSGKLGEVEEKGVEIQVNRFVGEALHQDLVLTNHTLAPLRLELSWEVEADFADLLEVLENRRLQEAPVAASWENGKLSLRYEHPELEHGLELTPPPHSRWGEGLVRLSLELPCQTPVRISLDLHPIFCGKRVEQNEVRQTFSQGIARDERSKAWFDRCTRFSSPNAVVRQAWERAKADLGSLPLWEGKGSEIYVPAAGIPLYQALFGRDTLTAAWQSSLLNPIMLRGTLERMKEELGKTFDAFYDEQPGRIIHQHQRSPLSLLGFNPYFHYYGDFAGPGMYLIAAAWYFALTNDREFLLSLRPAIWRILAWMDREGDPDGDGFYEYDTRSPQGTKNQGWKDSPEAILYPDGSCVPNPIAVVEVQGCYYAAKQLMGMVFLFLGERRRGVELLRQAEDLKRRFEKAYWMPEEGFYALALDPEKKPVRSIASNIGHCLACGIVPPEKARMVSERLMSPELFSGWGIRTLSSHHPAFNPFSYHLGTIWPPENASIALGFKRFGLDPLIHSLTEGMFSATLLFNQHRLPEAIGGNQRDSEHPHPGIYPQANAPQAWSSSAIIL
ncbi:MAG: glycogen debranching N-terminal domain-containing protein, partial [Bacteroidota bacterium]